jgi:hypothetical protein
LSRDRRLSNVSSARSTRVGTYWGGTIFRDREDAKTKAEQWKRYNETLLGRLFSNDSLATEYRDAGTQVTYRFLAATAAGTPLRGSESDAEVKACLATLEGILERLDLFPEPMGVVSSGAQAICARTSDVFLVHGHDEAAKQSVARFLERLELKPIILHECPNAGQTLVEKFEHHSDVGFAIVLMTPDDVGGAAGDRGNLSPRARQNVVLELGFFMGRLGRNRVCVLYKEGVEIPSDYDGVLYVPMDGNDAWRLQLANELKAAEIPFNPSGLLK